MFLFDGKHWFCVITSLPHKFCQWPLLDVCRNKMCFFLLVDSGYVGNPMQCICLPITTLSVTGILCSHSWEKLNSGLVHWLFHLALLEVAECKLFYSLWLPCCHVAASYFLCGCSKVVTMNVIYIKRLHVVMSKITADDTRWGLIVMERPHGNSLWIIFIAVGTFLVKTNIIL